MLMLSTEFCFIFFPHHLRFGFQKVDAVHHMEVPFLAFSNQILENLVLQTLLCLYIFLEDESDICSKAGSCLHPEDVLHWIYLCLEDPEKFLKKISF